MNMNYYLKSIFLIFFLIFGLSGIFAENILYVGDGTGIDPNCATPDYGSINNAINYAESTNLDFDIIICEGHYNEDIEIIGNNLIIQGENSNVFLEGVRINFSLISINDSENITLKNLSLTTSALNTVYIDNSEDIILEDLDIYGVQGIHSMQGDVGGIFVNNSSSIFLKGNILIRNIFSEKNIGALRISNSILTIETDSFEINNLESYSGYARAINVLDSSKLYFSSDYEIREIKGKNVNGFFVHN